MRFAKFVQLWIRGKFSKEPTARSLAGHNVDRHGPGLLVMLGTCASGQDGQVG